ncbi:MAG: hypothetical protein WC542_00160 [Paludibacter sp.]
MKNSICSLSQNSINFCCCLTKTKDKLFIFCTLIVLTFFANSCTIRHGVVMTVNGPISANKLGTTLPHEHVLVDFARADKGDFARWNKDTVISKALPFLLEAKKSGVNSMFECTTAYAGRDPELFQKLSNASGLNIITNTGNYGAINDIGNDYEFAENAEQISKRWIDEWKNGIGTSGVRPGFIKIGVPPDSVLQPIQEKVVTAAALTHLKTGLTINVHIGPFHTANAVLKILKKEGVDPSAFIWTHAQVSKLEDLLYLAGMGAWISLDNVSENNINNYVAMLSDFKRNQLLNKVLISHDAGWYDVVNPKTVTYRGYTTVFTHLKPALMQAGLTEKEWKQLTCYNPMNAYSIRVRKLTNSNKLDRIN